MTTSNNICCAKCWEIHSIPTNAGFPPECYCPCHSTEEILDSSIDELVKEPVSESWEQRFEAKYRDIKNFIRGLEQRHVIECAAHERIARREERHQIAEELKRMPVSFPSMENDDFDAGYRQAMLDAIEIVLKKE